jgi:hypothetical protein
VFRRDAIKRGCRTFARHYRATLGTALCADSPFLAAAFTFRCPFGDEFPGRGVTIFGLLCQLNIQPYKFVLQCSV